MNDVIKVAVDVFVIRDGKVLLGKRKGSFGAGQWGLPGGHLEYGERMADAAARELLEETGMTAKSLVFEHVVNNLGKGKHYVHVSFKAINPVGEPKVTEPDRCEEWRWFGLDALPKDLYIAHERHLKAFVLKQPFIE
jgi:8-oxo-dGTP diphosphatase